MNLCDAMERNLLNLSSHARERKCGHPDFTIAFFNSITLETIGLDKDSSEEAFLNREDVSMRRQTLNRQIESLQSDMNHATSELDKTINRFEEARSLFQPQKRKSSQL